MLYSAFFFKRMSPVEHLPVLRVAQLDTAELDNQLLGSLRQSINDDYFKYIQAGFVQKYHAEIFAALKFVLWYNTYLKRGQTVGQSLFDWSHVNRSGIKLIAHCLVYCLDEWLEQRLADLVRLLFKCFLALKRRLTISNDDAANLNKLERVVERVQHVLRVASLVNFALFLLEGKYLHLWERLLRLRPVYKRQQFMRESNTDVVAREHLWQSYFALFKLGDSLLNFRSFYAKIVKKYTHSYNNRATRAADTTINFAQCAICDQAPTNVHQAIDSECKHLFCYYCIATKIGDSLTNEFECSKCFKPIKRVQMYFNNENLM